MSRRLPVIHAGPATAVDKVPPMPVEIAKSFDFDAAHFLPLVPDGHKCKRMHGHTYRVEIICSGTPDDRAMVEDNAEIAIAWDPIHTLLDHRLLNELPGLENPTAENLAPWIMSMVAAVLPHAVRVRVYESSTTWCEVCR